MSEQTPETNEEQPDASEERRPFYEKAARQSQQLLGYLLDDTPELESAAFIFTWKDPVATRDVPVGGWRGRNAEDPGQDLLDKFQALESAARFIRSLNYECTKSSRELCDAVRKALKVVELEESSGEEETVPGEGGGSQEPATTSDAAAD